MNPKGRNDYLSEANRLLCNSDADYYTLLKDAEEKLYEMVDAKINAYEDSSVEKKATKSIWGESWDECKTVYDGLVESGVVSNDKIDSGPIDIYKLVNIL